MRRRAIIFALFATGLVSQSFAEGPVVQGSWSFTAWTGDGCDFNGVATLGPENGTEGEMSCELTARQSCSADLSWTVRQTCTAKRMGNRVIIRSEIAEFLEGPGTDSYLPDNFVLTIDTARRMFGALHSYGVYKSEWVRDEGAVS